MMSAELRNETSENPETHETSNLPMVWSIFAGDPDNWTPETPMDFRAPAEVPDGVYTVVNHSHMGAENAQKTVLIDGYTVGIGEAHGLEISDGHFVPESTAWACFKALCISEGINYELVPDGEQISDHIFIEALDFDSQSQKFTVGLGS